MELNNIIIDGKQFNKCFQKFYTVEEYSAIKDSFDFRYLIEEIHLTDEGKFHIGYASSWTKIKETIGYAVLNWYELMPKNIKSAINKLVEKQSETAAVVFLDAIKEAAEDESNSLPKYMYPALYMHGHENCWNTDIAWGKIELNNSALDADYWAWGNEGPCASSISNDIEFEHNYHPETFKSATSMIRLIKRFAITGSVKGYEVKVPGELDGFSPHYCRGYKPHVNAYKKFCQDYAAKHDITKQNKYEFEAEETRHGYNPWHNSRTSSSRTVTYEVFGDTKSEAYAIFKDKVANANLRYSSMWFPGTEGRPC